MSTHELFQKHFGNTGAVDMKHPNMEIFFEELNAECLAEDKQKNCNIPPVIKSVCDVCGSDDVIEVPHMGKNCNRCHPL